MSRKLSAIEVNTIKKSGFYRAGETLYLKVKSGAMKPTKSWIQRIVINSQRRDIGLGRYPLVSLSEARELALRNRKIARGGGDPYAEMRKAKMTTFREAAEKTFEANRPRWKNGKHLYNWMRGMEKYVFPVVGDLRVDQIEREHVLRILSPIWATKPGTARKLRQRIRTVFSWCQAHGYIEHNVAGEMINGALPPMPIVKANFRALPYHEVSAALQIVEASQSSLSAKLCFRFIALTAVRSGEARGAVWSEIDLEAREWRIPGERMKNGVEHRVPLSDAALAVLEQAQALRGYTDLIFASNTRPHSPLSNMTLTKILRTSGLAEKTTVHGLRSAFRTWAAEQTDAPHAVMELALSHSVGSAVEQAYARSDLLDKRRRLMQRWGEFVSVSKTEA